MAWVKNKHSLGARKKTWYFAAFKEFGSSLLNICVYKIFLFTNAIRNRQMGRDCWASRLHSLRVKVPVCEMDCSFSTVAKWLFSCSFPGVSAIHITFTQDSEVSVCELWFISFNNLIIKFNAVCSLIYRQDLNRTGTAIYYKDLHETPLKLIKRVQLILPGCETRH